MYLMVIKKRQVKTHFRTKRYNEKRSNKTRTRFCKTSNQSTNSWPINQSTNSCSVRSGGSWPWKICARKLGDG